ncbi:hypothetical protein [Allokutzneria oryzae]|uniref:Uncharacterized protein n=1 Tax=Allokutzneria oryzae TaxID=1378989 RepID=A0ABV5ZTK1_9PSEU
MAGMVVAAPAAFADGCSTDPYGKLTCTAYPASGGFVSLHGYPRSNGVYMQGTDSWNRPVHLDRARPGGWDGPLGAGIGQTAEMFRAGTSWRACVNVGSNRFHCTPFA